MKNPELLEVPVQDVKEYRKILSTNIKEITESEDLMKRFLVC